MSYDNLIMSSVSQNVLKFYLLPSQKKIYSVIHVHVHAIEIMNTIEVEISLFESILSVTPQDSHCISFGDCVIETFFIRVKIFAFSWRKFKIVITSSLLRTSKQRNNIQNLIFKKHFTI
jgi:hypothetical protein